MQTNNDDLTSYIALKYFPVQCTEEYFNNLPDEVIHVLYESMVSYGFHNIGNNLYAYLYIKRNAILDAFIFTKINQPPHYKTCNNLLENALVKYYANK